ncbi:hypothetical protein EX895_001007 [Sporisorium graminicola]|uniref:Uncharacterized protein n=1 Tax=Sporisorium graminicola TaxID=280036 RepID=A0A4U7L4U7_9BASI|nr:hypothetical protein EX895_001007 [Sporisorium graminicola]TKY91008.1 hypothetical protein EX895_001007 [Sporisorium graminicola]
MAATQSKATPANVKIYSDKKDRLKSALSMDQSVVWYDSDSNSGEDAGEDGEEAVEGDEDEDDEGRGDDDEDGDSTDSADSSDSVSTPESSPPPNRHTLFHGQDDRPATAFGAFDATGDWVWSKRTPNGASDERSEGQEANLHVQPVLNRHDRTQMVMAESLAQRTSDVFWPTRGHMDVDELRDQDENSFDVVGYTSYQSRRLTSSSATSEGHGIVVPVRIRLEDDSSSDESECSTLTSSSSGSDSEARRRASMNMLQRLGRNVAVPPRRASAMRLGHGAPRRPPSLDEISSRVVSGCGNVYGRGTPPVSAALQQRAVSCPSPLPLQRAWFGEVQVMVTPPTPQLPAEKIPGVVLKNSHMPSCSFSTDAWGNLVAPKFDVAPGRQIMLAEREEQAKQWLEAFKRQQQQQQQERHGLNLDLGAGNVAPPIANGTQAAAKFTPSSPTRCKTPSPSLSNSADRAAGTLPSLSGGPVIPPRRRSFGRRLSGQLHPNAQAAGPTFISSTASGDTTVELLHSDAPSCTQDSGPPSPTVPNCRSLVAKLSLRRSSKEAGKTQAPLLVPRKPVPCALD